MVAKLLNMVSPDVAYFGQKDAQQSVVIRRMVRDLDLPVRIEVCPTVRAADGLALSSRNALLSADERERATALSRALEAVRAAVADGERDPERATAGGRDVLARRRPRRRVPEPGRPRDDGAGRPSCAATRSPSSRPAWAPCA